MQYGRVRCAAVDNFGAGRKCGVMNCLNDGEVRVAVPLTAQNLREVEREWEHVAALRPDLIEWRLDALTPDRLDSSLAAIAELGMSLRRRFRIPVLATVRTSAEGGAYNGSDSHYREVVLATSTWADLVDVEVGRPGAARLIAKIKAGAKDGRPGVVGSFHDFINPPSSGVTRQLLEHMQSLGCAVAKVAWMVRSDDDLGAVLAVQSWAAQNLQIPALVIGMGEAGRPSRLGAAARQSAFTFARGVRESAPGQPSVEAVRRSAGGRGEGGDDLA